MTRMDNEKFKNGNYKIENRLKASDKRWEARTAHQEKAIKGKVKRDKQQEAIDKNVAGIHKYNKEHPLKMSH